MTRVGVLHVWHETNTYSKRPASLEAFREFELAEGIEILERHTGTRTVLGGIIAAAGSLTLVPLLSAAAWPCGPAPAEVADMLLARLERTLAEAGPVDAVVADLHGAMVAEGHPDMEAELIKTVRAAYGRIPIGVVLDLHANVSRELIDACNLVVAYDTYPHVDMWERGAEMIGLIREVLEGRRLSTFVARVPILTTPLAQATDESPMRDLHAVARELASTRQLRRVSLAPGFPYSDTPRTGFSILVIAGPSEVGPARDTLRELVLEVEAHAADFVLRRDDPGLAVSRAIRVDTGPTVLVDVADNVGGGSPGDGTALLAELLRQGATDAVVMIADAAAVAAALEVGEGGVVDKAIGARTDDLHGEPVRIRGRVERLSAGRYVSHGSYMTGQTFEMGQTALLRVGGVSVVATERATPPFHSEQLGCVGINPGACRIIVAKGAVAWRSAFGAVARQVIEVDTPGICPLDPMKLPRKTPPSRIDP